MIKIALINHQILIRAGLALLIKSYTNCSVVIEANNGEDFIEQLHATTALPDIVVTDIYMPVMNGFEIAKWVRENLPNTKVVALTRELDDLSVITMLKNGAKAYINKNISSAEFKEVLNEIYTNGIYFNDILYKNLVHTLQNGVEEAQDNYQRLIALPEREKDFLKWLCTEKSLKQIAVEMHVSPRTIDGYRDSLFEKIKVSSRIGLVLFAIKNQLVKL